jgi:hypothetical protein
MFVRFRAVRHRLVVNLVAARPADGKIVSEHIARLGSAALPEPISAVERILFWHDLKDRWRDLIDRLGNRVTADDRKKVLAAVHARIPKPTEAERQAARIEAARDKVETWEELRASSSRRIELERKSIDTAQRSIAEDQTRVDLAAQNAHAARMVALKLMRSERVDGDDELMLDYIAGAANKRAARVRAAPRPAARGRRGRQKRPRGLKAAELTTS